MGILMAVSIDDISRTFDEFLLLPGLTEKKHIPSQVSLRAPLARGVAGGKPLMLNVPFVSAAMQAVSGPELCIALARKGGVGFIYCSQSIESQVAMVQQVKEHKAGFVRSDTNLRPSDSLRKAVELKKKTGHSTVAITEDGTGRGVFRGLLLSDDYWEFKDDLDAPIEKYFRPVSAIQCGTIGITLAQATTLLWQNKAKCLPVLEADGRLNALVFRKDFFDHQLFPDEVTDEQKRLVVGAGVNTHDYRDRVPELVKAGADVLCFDSSDGYTEWQKDGIRFVKEEMGADVVVGAGNVVTKAGFRYLADAGCDFVKVGIGGGSICITRGQKGIGRGQASAVFEIAAARDEYWRETGVYVPICSDGGLGNDTHIIMALALGADFVMMGKYFAMTAESPTPTIRHRGSLYKPYWGEGSIRARNWQRYGGGGGLKFEEGVDAFVPFSGPLSDKVDLTTAKLRSTMCNIGALSLREFQEKAELTLVSPMTFVEGGTSGVEQLDRHSVDGERA
jgi:IMP dehydrogenase